MGKHNDDEGSLIAAIFMIICAAIKAVLSLVMETPPSTKTQTKAVKEPSRFVRPSKHGPGVTTGNY